MLRHAEGWDHIDVDQDEEVAVGRVILNMVRAALPLDAPHEAALTN